MGQPKPNVVNVGVLAEALPQPHQIVDAPAPARQALDHQAPPGDVTQALHLAPAEPAADIAAGDQAFLLLKPALGSGEILQSILDRPHEGCP